MCQITCKTLIISSNVSYRWLIGESTEKGWKRIKASKDQIHQAAPVGEDCKFRLAGGFNWRIPAHEHVLDRKSFPTTPCTPEYEHWWRSCDLWSWSREAAAGESLLRRMNKSLHRDEESILHRDEGVTDWSCRSHFSDYFSAHFWDLYKLLFFIHY